MSENTFHLKIRNFSYNGFCGKLLNGYAKYTGLFIKWTNDAGVALIKCSDGKERLVPSFALDGVTPPEPDYNKMKQEGTFLYFGTPSNS